MAARKLPSLNALRAFEASARHCSFTLAAQELHVTQGAVSHQIKALEDELGLPLFERLPNQLRLTRAGRDYLGAIGDAFDRIERATGHLRTPAGRQRLAISCSPNFSSKWLVPRLGEFSAQHPDLELRLEQSERHANFVRDDIDVAIRYGIGPWPDLACLRLGDECLVPVCSPALPAVRSAPELAAATLLHVHDQRGWADWFSARGLAAPAKAGIVFNHESASIDAALAGQGVALARSSLVALALRQQTLVAPFAPGPALAEAYWMICPLDRRDQEKLVLFADWLRRSVEADRQFRAAAYSGDSA